MRNMRDRRAIRYSTPREAAENRIGSRLFLRPLDLADADALQQIFPRWEIVRFLGLEIPWPYPQGGALTFIRETALPAMRQGSEWHWTIRPKMSSRRLSVGLRVRRWRPRAAGNPGLRLL